MAAKPKSQTIFDTAIIIALCTMVLYFYSYSYQVGYYAYFQIPVSYISIDTSLLTNFGSSVLPGLICMLFIGYCNYLLYLKYSKQNGKSVLIVVIIETLLFILFNGSLTGYLELVIVRAWQIPVDYLIYLICSLIIFLLAKNKIGVLFEKMSPAVYEFLSVTLLFALVLNLFIYTYDLGTYKAGITSDFYLTGAHFDEVILAKYDDILIGKPINMKTRFLSDTLKFHKLDQGQGLTLVRRSNFFIKPIPGN